MVEILGFLVAHLNKNPTLLLVDAEGRLYSSGIIGEEALWTEQRRGFSQVKKVSEKEIGDPLEIRQDTLGELEPPAPYPSKIVGVGKSYAAHAREFGSEAVEEPDYFLIAPSALVGHGHPVRLPPPEVTRKVDYEGEIVLVIGKRITRATPQEAREAILGYTLGNDVTARDLQIEKGKPWSLAKSLDTFKPLGPLVRIVGDPGELENLCLKTTVSGEVMQRGCVGDMVMALPELVASISRYLTLEPGDLIYTGTPPGVGYARSPPRLLRSGDVVEVELTQPLVGGMLLRNSVV